MLYHWAQKNAGVEVLISRRLVIKGSIVLPTFSWGLQGCGGGDGDPSSPQNTEDALAANDPPIAEDPPPEGPPANNLTEEGPKPPQNDFSGLKLASVEVARIKYEQTQAAGLADEARVLLEDIASLERAAVTAPITPTRAIGFNPAPKILTGNPHLEALYSWAEARLAKTANVYSKSTVAKPIFPSESYNETRALVGTVERLIWLLLSPVSRYRYNVQLFKDLLLIVYATSDDFFTSGGSLNDWFAAPGAAYSWRILDEAFSGLLPALLLNRIRWAADKMGSTFYRRSLNEMKEVAPYSTYCNLDISCAEVMMHTGMHRGNVTWTERAKLVIDLMMGPTVLYADGAYSYIGDQNESANYHGGTTTSLGNLYTVTGNPEILTAIAKAKNYELLTVEQGFVNEFYTVPAWKTAWNGIDGVSFSFLSYISQSAHWQTFGNVRRRVIPPSSNVLDAAFYTAPIQGKPLVDNYLVYDRNIQGPRYRRNNFSYAMTTRRVSLPDNVGALTLVGAMTTQDSPDTITKGSSRRFLSDALMSVHAKVHINKNSAAEWETWAYLIGDTSPQTTMSRTVGAISTPCSLYRQTSGPTGHPTNWQSFQQWLALPGRLVGIVEVYPKGSAGQSAFKIDGRIKFGYGRSGTRFKKTLRTITVGKEYLYGNLRLLVHAHDFTTVDTAPAGVLRDAPPDATEIRFRYIKPGTDGTTNVRFPGDTRKFFLVEIRDNSVTTPITVTRHDAAGVKGLVVSDGQNRYAVFRNLNTTEASFSVTNYLTAGLRTTVHYPRSDIDPGIAPTEFTGSTLSIPVNEQRLLVTSTAVNDHEPSWAHYDDLLARLPALTILTEGAQTTVCTAQANRFVALTNNLGLSTTYQWTINDVAVAGAVNTTFNPSNLTKGMKINCLITTNLDNGTPFSLKSNTLVALC